MNRQTEFPQHKFIPRTADGKRSGKRGNREVGENSLPYARNLAILRLYMEVEANDR